MDAPMGLPHGTIRGIAFLLVVGTWALSTLGVIIGAIFGPVTMEQLEKYITIVVVPPVSLSFGFYFGQKIGAALKDK